MIPNPDDPCLCGHKRENHRPTSVPFIYCDMCYREHGELESIHDFELDNLGYLQMKYESKHPNV